jgi:SAM-dependent methyltransferase
MPDRSIFVQLPDARRVLDIGCGTGWVTAEAQTSGTLRCFGVDILLDDLREGKSTYPRMLFAAADGARLPFRNASFDVVVGHVSVPYMNTDEALQEIFRVLAPGGSVLVTFHSFAYLARRFRKYILRLRQWKEFSFLAYLAVNGILNHLSLPQIRMPWNRRVFETVHTRGGIYRSARRAGFVFVSVEHTPRFFFAVTARKPNGQAGEVLPAPGWAIHCGLAAAVEEVSS